MSTASAIALSGMNAATARLEASARNIADASADDATPQQVAQSDTSSAQSVPLALRPAYSHKAPNEDGRAFAANPYSVLSNEMVQALVARFDLIADAHVIGADAAMQAAALYQHP